jgi:putative Mn2+ efflux pump MntP
MDLPSILLLAVGLSLDALAVSLCSGLAVPRVRLSHALKMASFFGGFQMLMPVLGWFAGYGLRRFITGVDHWIAFGLLLLVGGRMIYEALHEDSCEARPDPFRWATLFALAVATSIDALAVGVTLSFLTTSLVVPVAIIGAVTFALSFGGVLAGRRIGGVLGNKVEIAGGVILIGIGLKILIEHLVA